jgi:superfamily II DNA/RNA helicase
LEADEVDFKIPMQGKLIYNIRKDISKILTSPGNTGKTLGPVIGTVAKIIAEKEELETSDALAAVEALPAPYVFILVPTHELTRQVQGNCAKYASCHNDVRVAILKGTWTGRASQVTKLRKGCETLVGTPKSLAVAFREDRKKLVSSSNLLFIFVDKAHETLATLHRSRARLGQRLPQVALQRPRLAPSVAERSHLPDFEHLESGYLDVGSQFGHQCE